MPSARPASLESASSCAAPSSFPSSAPSASASFSETGGRNGDENGGEIPAFSLRIVNIDYYLDKANTPQTERVKMARDKRRADRAQRVDSALAQG